MNTFATGSLPVHFSVAKLFNFRWQYTISRNFHGFIGILIIMSIFAYYCLEA